MLCSELHRQKFYLIPFAYKMFWCWVCMIYLSNPVQTPPVSVHLPVGRYLDTRKVDVRLPGDVSTPDKCRPEGLIAESHTPVSSRMSAT